MSTDRGGVATPDLQARLAESVRAGRPFAADLFGPLAAATGAQLYHALYSTKAREVLYHPSPELRKHERRAAFVGQEHLGLTWLFRRKLQQGTVRPSLYRVLTALRCQFGSLLSELPEVTARRLRHVMQVQLTPPLVREKMLGLTGVSFSVSRRTPDLPAGPVSLSCCRAQWLYFFRAAAGQAFVTTRLREASLRVDPDSHAVTFGPDLAEYDFSYLPVPSGRGRIMPLEKVVTFENALAVHEAVEMAVVTGVGRRQHLVTPKVYVGTESPEDFSSREATPQLLDLCQQALSRWWERDRLAPLEAPPGDAKDRRLDASAWLRYLAREDVRSRLMFPTESLEGHLEQMGDDCFAGFVDSVFRSHLIRAGRHVLVPLEFFNAHSDQDPVRKCGGRLYVGFPPELRGRDSCSGGSLRRLAEASAAQVLEQPPAPEEEFDALEAEAA